MKILAIDTSADETASAVVEGRRILSNVLYSQIELHRPWGGIYPALAKRAHEQRIDAVVKKALDRGVGAGRSMTKQMGEIGAVAVTQGPGLAVALEVGIKTAKTLAQTYAKPVIAVNHLAGHLYSCFAQNRNGKPDFPLRFPYLGLIVSGGHTELVVMRDELKYEVVGQTRDDAAGEALDKAAKLMGLGYPGGPVIERLADSVGHQDQYRFPRPMLNARDLSFSFSGLKTAFYYFVKEMPASEKNRRLPHLLSSFQEAVFTVLIKKTQLALRRTKLTRLAVGGGVIANRHLRRYFRQLARQEGVELYFPYKSLTGDNAAMIGIAAGCLARHSRFVTDPAALDRVPRLAL